MLRSTFLVLVACVFGLSPALAETRKATAVKKPAPKPVPTSPTTRSVATPFAATEESGPPNVRGESYIVVDAQTGRVIHEKNADQQRPVASTQKLLTGLIVAEEGNLDANVTIKPSDTWAEPSKLYIKPGEVYER